jgi:hypothetical protein
LAYWSLNAATNAASFLQVAILVSGEASLLARHPGKKSSQHVLDLGPYDLISAGPLLEAPELCTVVAKVEAEVLLIGRNAFEEHLAEVCCRSRVCQQLLSCLHACSQSALDLVPYDLIPELCTVATKMEAAVWAVIRVPSILGRYAVLK